MIFGLSTFEFVVSLVAFVALGFGYVVALSDSDMKKYRRKWRE